MFMAPAPLARIDHDRGVEDFIGRMQVPSIVRVDQALDGQTGSNRDARVGEQCARQPRW